MYTGTNLLLLLMRIHIHKIKFRPYVVIEILLVYHSEVTWGAQKRQAKLI